MSRMAIGRFTFVAGTCALAITTGGAASRASAEGTVTIDARGQAHQRVSFGTSARIVVAVENKNPFLYRYRTIIDEVAVQETAPLLFVAQLSPLLSVVAAGAAGGPAPAAAPGGPSRAAAFTAGPNRGRMTPPDSCKPPALADAAVALAWIDDERDRVRRFAREADAEIRELEAGYVLARTEIERQRLALRSKAATWPELETAAAAIKAAAERFPRPSAVDGNASRLRTVPASAKVLLVAIEDYRERFPTCQPVLAGGNPLIPDQVYLEGLIGWWLEERQAVVATVRSGRDALSTLLGAIERVTVEGSHSEVHKTVGNYSTPTRVTVKVKRWPIEDAEEKSIETVATATLEFGGGARFVLSGGLGLVGGIRHSQFLQARGFEKNAKGEVVGQELGPVVGLKGEEESAIVPALLLNTRLHRFGEERPVQSLYLTTGITAKKEGEVEVDYLVGLTAGMLGDKVLISVAVYYGRETSLAGDLFVGAKIPEALTVIPVSRSRKSGGGIFVTYRIR